MQRFKENKRIYTSEPDYDWAKESLIERRLDDEEPIDDISDDDIWQLSEIIGGLLWHASQTRISLM